MLWFKAFHIFFVVSWFAGLFYLPRIFVNLALIERLDSAEGQRLLLMARKLYRFVTPIAVLALALGFWLWLAYGFSGGWLHVKLALVVLLVAYHFYMAKLLAHFESGRNRRTPLWYRVFNELPVLLLLSITVLVTVKPF
jgi:putative membrane protein